MAKKAESFSLEQVQEIVKTALAAAKEDDVAKRDINRGAFWPATDKKAKYDYIGTRAVHVQCPHCEEIAEFSGCLYKQPKSGKKPRFILSLFVPKKASSKDDDE